jgi:2-deoxy-D-gluconate 3-dehydrogenase
MTADPNIAPLRFDVGGKVALVTGAARGLGRACAIALAQAGADVALGYRDARADGGTTEVIRALGRRALPLQMDVTRGAEIAAAVAEAEGAFGRIDILINNAGINIRKPAHELPVAQWQQVIDTNLTSAFVCSRAVYPHLQRAGGGKIINIGSMLSIFGASFAPAYGASKGGIVQLTKSLAVGWAADNIQVNAVLPGWIDTDLTRQARQQLPGLNERVLARSPSGRWGTIDDFEGIAVFLASPASAFITGTAIAVDGGYSTQV